MAKPCLSHAKDTSGCLTPSRDGTNVGQDEPLHSLELGIAPSLFHRYHRTLL